MFVTDALRGKVEAYLATMERCAAWLAEAARTLQEEGETLASDVTLRLAAERALHVAIESALDAANTVIDALVMREPGGYADMIRVLAEEGVVSRSFSQAFAAALSFRSRLVRDYLQLTAEEVADAVRQLQHLFPEFAASLRRYLQIQPSSTAPPPR
ncbi:hypothetical protein GCM10010885_03980 [Alicyclobacillus cellulosilyticus]|uniref:DUF86 domain-containing protein n=1 Tax=Alicyclobacillus cellulosilyticus TaxID=1003997 RepID=A0A917NFA5_9BACL|nr:HepT-like ribonuclease domain-containing protein [Alicyclobacillus cellulosilyticus]GGI97533.1 hypothetical protein GCM10010885_03980 [Alicyclobacillus cellulosilyticus]